MLPALASAFWLHRKDSTVTSMRFTSICRRSSKS
jgi:hypothetical protein